MSDLTNVFSNIANSIREKSGDLSLRLRPVDMANAINNIKSASTDPGSAALYRDGGGVEIIQTSNLSKAFQGKSVPGGTNVTINLSSVTDLSWCFSNCAFEITPPNISFIGEGFPSPCSLEHCFDNYQLPLTDVDLTLFAHNVS